MVKLILGMIILNEEQWLPLSLESVEGEIDHYIFVDGGSTDGTLEFIKEFSKTHNVTLLDHPFRHDYIGADGYQRNFYLEYAKKHFKNEYMLVIDADEIVKKKNFSLKEYINTMENKGVYCCNLMFHHLINSFGYEDSTLENHFTMKRYFKIIDDINYPEIEHNILQGHDKTANVDLEIYHFANARSIGFYLLDKYKNNIKKGNNTHNKDFFKEWYLTRLLDVYPKKKVDPKDLPRVIKKHFLLDKLLFPKRNKLKTMIIIPTVPGNEQNLLNCIQHILQNTPKDEFDIYICMNDYKGFSYGINKGLKASLSNEDIDSVLLLNDDVNLKRDWLDKLRQGLFTADITSTKISYRGHHIAFYATIIKKEVIEKIGLLDERFKIGEGEDVDYCIRAQDFGFTLGYIDDPEEEIFTHERSHTMGNLSDDQESNRVNNRQLLLDKYKGTKWEQILQQ